MIAKILKVLLSPQGVLVQALLEQVAKVFKSDKVLKYVEMENELDKAVKEMKKEFTSMKFKVNAQRDLFKDIQDQIDSIKKIAHPPKDFTKKIETITREIGDVKITVKGFSNIFNKMKKLPLLKSLFKNG